VLTGPGFVEGLGDHGEATLRHLVHADRRDLLSHRGSVEGMPFVEDSRGLEWSHVYFFDAGADEDTTDWDPAAQVVYATVSTLIVRGRPEGDGDTFVRIAVDEEADLARTPVLLATGSFQAPSGSLVARTSSWDEPLRLAVPPGRHDFTVHADDQQWPTRIAIDLVGGQER
jgi:hypothetical protein